MEFDNLDELIEWEARCVAAAFGIEVFDPKESEEWERNYQGSSDDITVYWTIDVAELTLSHISVRFGAGYETAVKWWLKWEMHCTSHAQRDLLERRLAYGLYRLGIEDEEALPELTAHEKLELRLSMPREFWPKTWLEEEMPMLGGDQDRSTI